MDKDYIKRWLKENGHDRQWLANRCGVSLPTVHGWLSSGRRMSDSAKKLCEAAILGPYIPKIEFSFDEWLSIQNAAQKAGADDISDWLKQLALKELETTKVVPIQYQENLPKTKVAEPQDRQEQPPVKKRISKRT